MSETYHYTTTETTTTPETKEFGPYDVSKYKYLKCEIINCSSNCTGNITLNNSTKKDNNTSFTYPKYTSIFYNGKLQDSEKITINSNGTIYVDLQNYEKKNFSFTITCSTGSFTIKSLTLTNKER